MTTKHPCEACGRETDLRGWFFVGPRGRVTLSPRQWRKRYHWWCKDHFLIMMFGLYPYRCTAACRKKREVATRIRLNAASVYVWLQMEAVMVAVDPKAKTSPMRSLGPRCPWCSKPMRFAKVPTGLYGNRK